MSYQKPAAPVAGSAGKSVLSELKNDIEAQRARLNEEIGSYPGPIPACDAQFNYLLAERSKLSAELNLVQALLAGTRADSEDDRAIERLLVKLSQIDADMAERLRAVFDIDPSR